MSQPSVQEPGSTRPFCPPASRRPEQTAPRPTRAARTCFGGGAADGEVEVGCGRGSYLGLGRPQHVLLLLKDGIHAIKKLHALLGDPAKETKQIELKIEMKHLLNMSRRKTRGHTRVVLTDRSAWTLHPVYRHFREASVNKDDPPSRLQFSSSVNYQTPSYLVHYEEKKRVWTTAVMSALCVNRVRLHDERGGVQNANVPRLLQV